MRFFFILLISAIVASANQAIRSGVTTETQTDPGWKLIRGRFQPLRTLNQLQTMILFDWRSGKFYRISLDELTEEERALARRQIADRDQVRAEAYNVENAPIVVMKPDELCWDRGPINISWPLFRFSSIIKLLQEYNLLLARGMTADQIYNVLTKTNDVDLKVATEIALSQINDLVHALLNVGNGPAAVSKVLQNINNAMSYNDSSA